jgi:hypothetical protein
MGGRLLPAMHQGECIFLRLVEADETKHLPGEISLLQRKEQVTDP